MHVPARRTVTPLPVLGRRPLAALGGRPLPLVAAVVLILMAGTAGYMLIEHFSVIDALYMTVITLSTVGFREVHELTAAGRVFTIVLIVAGVGTLAFTLRAAGEYIVGGQLRGTVQRRRMQRQLDAIKGHYIICGYGRVGQQVAYDLSERHAQCVVIDTNDALLDPSVMRHAYVHGDGADDDVLRRAGIDRANGVVVCTGDDATNLFVILTARTLRSDVVIVSRANSPATEPKLRRAGATHVISPYEISGRRIATQILYPAIIDFFDVVMQSDDLELWIEEVDVAPGCDLDGQTLAEAHVRSRTGANVLAARHQGDRHIQTSLAASYRFTAGDVLVVLGTGDQIDALCELAGRQDREHGRRHRHGS